MQYLYFFPATKVFKGNNGERNGAGFLIASTTAMKPLIEVYPKKLNWDCVNSYVCLLFS